MQFIFVRDLGFSARCQRVRCRTVENFGGFHQRFRQRGVRMDGIGDIPRGSSHFNCENTFGNEFSGVDAGYAHSEDSFGIGLDN